MISLNRLGDLVRALAQLVPRRSLHSPIELETFGPTGLREKGLAIEPLRHPLRDSTTFDNRRPGTGVEVEDHVIRRRRYRFSFGDVPDRHMEFDGREVGGP